MKIEVQNSNLVISGIDVSEIAIAKAKTSSTGKTKVVFASGWVNFQTDSGYPMTLNMAIYAKR